MTIFSRLADVRRQAGLNQDDFADRMGVSKSTQVRYESGATPMPLQYIEAVCKTFPDLVDFNWLTGGVVQKDLHVRLAVERDRLGYTDADLADHVVMPMARWSKFMDGHLVPDGGTLAQLIALGMDAAYLLTGRSVAPVVRMGGGDDEYAMVPQYDVACSAGAGALIEAEPAMNGFVAFSVRFLNRLGITSGCSRLAEISGDSMATTMHDGDLVLINLDENQFRNDGIYAFQLHGALRIKRLQAMLDGSLKIISDNPKYSTISISPEEASDLHIIGRVVWHGQPM